jgi:hypothetical protein
MTAFAAAQQRTGRPDRSLHCQWGAFSKHMVGVAAARRRGGGDNGAAGECKSSQHDWEAMMSRAGEIDRFHEDGFLAPPSPLPSRGSPVVAAWRRHRRGGGRSQQRSSHKKRRHRCGKRRGFLRDDGCLHSLVRRMLC